MSNKTKHVRVSTETHRKLKTEAASSNTSMTLLLEKKLSEEVPDEANEYFIIVTNKEVDEIAMDKIGRKLTEEERFEFAGPVLNEAMGAINDIILDMEEFIDTGEESHPEPPKATNSTVNDF